MKLIIVGDVPDIPEANECVRIEDEMDTHPDFLRQVLSIALHDGASAVIFGSVSPKLCRALFNYGIELAENAAAGRCSLYSEIAIGIAYEKDGYVNVFWVATAGRNYEFYYAGLL